jgi:CheY-like chemotaxis protein
MGARVLVVDDSPTIRKLVSAILARYDHEPAVAPDGHSALDRLRNEPFDLVLLDVAMPHMNGYQLCRAIRADEKISHLPVVLMSGREDNVRGEQARETGAIEAIAKPVDARSLVAVVESALQKAAEGRPVRDLSSPDQ